MNRKRSAKWKEMGDLGEVHIYEFAFRPGRLGTENANLAARWKKKYKSRNDLDNHQHIT